MGTIFKRKRTDGSFGFTAQLLIKRRGVKVHNEAKTFDREPAARAWMKWREDDIERDGFGKQRATLRDAIEKYVKESLKEIGRTKAQVLRTIGTAEISEMQCRNIRSNTLSPMRPIFQRQSNPRQSRITLATCRRSLRSESRHGDPLGKGWDGSRHGRLQTAWPDN